MAISIECQDCHMLTPGIVILDQNFVCALSLKGLEQFTVLQAQAHYVIIYSYIVLKSPFGWVCFTQNQVFDRT